MPAGRAASRTPYPLTTRRKERCAVWPWEESHGSSPAQSAGASYCSSRHPLISQRDFFGDCQTAVVATAERWLRAEGSRAPTPHGGLSRARPCTAKLADSACSAIKRRTVDVLTERIAAASLIVALPRSACSPGPMNRDSCRCYGAASRALPRVQLWPWVVVFPDRLSTMAIA